MLVKQCTIDDEGDYEVVIANSAGEVSHMFETIINAEPPKIVQALPTSVNTALHESAILKVVFSSPLQSKVTWLANGVMLEDSSKYGITTTESETVLNIADVIKDDTEMVYKCKVTNISGNAETSCSIMLPGNFLFKYQNIRPSPFYN